MSPASRIWFTIWHGILTEVYYPTIDCPQLRDLEFLFANGDDLFLEEKRDLDYEIERLAPSQGYKIHAYDRERRFSLHKEIIAEPNRPCVLMRCRLEGEDSFLKKLQLYLLSAPHLQVGGCGNNAFIVEVSGRNLLVAEKDNRWLVIGASCQFSKLSCGYVGHSDGYSDISKHRKMTYEFDEAKDGNVALTAQLDVEQTPEFTVGVAFGETLSSAVSCLFQSLGISYEHQRKLFLQQWAEASKNRLPLEKSSGDNGRLLQSSHNLLLTHEDKLYRGAFIASLSIPWGEIKDDKKGEGGYHLVWTRDMVQSALGLLALGDLEPPLRAFIYLAARQEEDGSFPQNFWVDGEAFRSATQLDEVAFPVILAWQLEQRKLLNEFDPRVAVFRAVSFLLHSGPVTGEERWEEASGYSPSTLAVIISAFVCAASFARSGNDAATAEFLESYADYVRSHLEEWTVTNAGSLLPDCSRYFVRLNPAKPGEVPPPGAVDTAQLKISGQPPGAPEYYPARDVVDAGFLQLVRYGILDPHSPLVKDTLRVIDSVLKENLPAGPCWHRYNHDGYGQRPDGSAFDGWGVGRVWPLFTGERGHYELAAGNDVGPFLNTIENLCNSMGLLPEQTWDQEQIPGTRLYCGGPSGSANPLLWAHSEYVRLLRSVHGGKVFDFIQPVADRYLSKSPSTNIEFWLPKHPISQARKNHTLRICATESFMVRWTNDNWKTYRDTESTSTAIRAEYVDLQASELGSQIEFTLFSKKRQQWEGRNFSVQIV